jgi:hypothetical protein
MVGPERAHELQLVGAGDRGDLRAHRLRDLDDERTDVARCAVHEDPIRRLHRSAAAAAQPLEGEHRRVRQRGRLLERHAGRHRLECLLARADVLGECAEPPCGEHVGHHVIPGLEAGHARPDRIDDTCGVDAHLMRPRRSEPHEQTHEAGLRLETIEVRTIYRRGAYSDEDLPFLGRWTLDVPDLHDLGRTVSISKGGLHHHPSSRFASSVVFRTSTRSARIE